MPKRTDKREVMGLEVDGRRVVGAVGAFDRGSGAVRVDGVASTAIPTPKAGSDGEAELAGAIADVRSRLPRAPRRVRLGVSGPDAAMRLIEVPRPRRLADLEAVIAQEAEQRLPMRLDHSYWTSRVLGSFSDAGSGRRARVLVAAAKRDVVDPACAATRAAGCEVVGVDLSAFAAIRSLPPRDGTWLGAVLGSQATLFVANGRECLFIRAPGDLSAAAGMEDGTPEGRTEAVEEIARRLAQEIRKTCQYQAGQDSAPAISQVTLTGAGADNTELAVAIANGLDLPVSVEAPVGAAQVDSSCPCSATIASGLCVEAVA